MERRFTVPICAEDKQCIDSESSLVVDYRFRWATAMCRAHKPLPLCPRKKTAISEARANEPFRQAVVRSWPREERWNYSSEASDISADIAPEAISLMRYRPVRAVIYSVLPSSPQATFAGTSSG